MLFYQPNISSWIYLLLAQTYVLQFLIDAYVEMSDWPCGQQDTIVYILSDSSTACVNIHIQFMWVNGCYFWSKSLQPSHDLTYHLYRSFKLIVKLFSRVIRCKNISLMHQSRAVIFPDLYFFIHYVSLAILSIKKWILVKYLASFVTGYLPKCHYQVSGMQTIQFVTFSPNFNDFHWVTASILAKC